MVVIDGKEYDTAVFDTDEFKRQCAEYEAIIAAVNRGKTVYLQAVKRSGIDIMARELVDNMGILKVFMERDADGIPVFYLPEVDFSRKSLFDGAVVHITRTEVVDAYSRYCAVFKKMMPPWDTYRNALKIRMAYERRNIEFLMNYEVKRIVDLRGVDLASDGV